MSASTTQASGTAAGGHIQFEIAQLKPDSPWRWLMLGWRDMTAAPGASIGYGVLIVAVSLALAGGLWLAGQLYLLLPLAAGFTFVAPLLAVGLYRVSRRREAGLPVSLPDTLSAWRVNSAQMIAIGLMLMLFLLAWVRIATLLFALFFGTMPPSWEGFVGNVLLSVQGLPFLIVGTAVGAALAVIVFACTFVSLPMLVDRDVGVLTALTTSVRATAKNWAVLLSWAGIIALFTAAGVVTLFLGLAVVIPLLGHATWHAYKDTVREQA